MIPMDTCAIERAGCAAGELASEPAQQPRRTNRPHVVVLGDPASKRVAQFLAAASGQGYRASVLSYRDYLGSDRPITAYLPPHAILRIDSPGEDPEIHRQLLRLGMQGPPDLWPEVAARAGQMFPLGDASKRLPPDFQPLSHREIEQLRFERGAIITPRQWYAGLTWTMHRLESELAGQTGVRLMAHPGDVPILFDKGICQTIWQQAGLTVPPFWLGLHSYDQLRAAFAGDRHKNLFLKLRHGYSAMGALALQWQGSRIRALAPLEICREDGVTRLYLSKRVQSLTDEHVIVELVNWLGREGVIVEPWLPKARIEGRNFDLRVVVIAGRVRHVVGRANYGPFTNLNLDGVRIAAADVQAHLGGEAWEQAMQLCAVAADCFPRSQYLGVDLLVRSDCRRFALLEGNAFGDYLPGLLDDEHCTTYEAELIALSRPGAVPCVT